MWGTTPKTAARHCLDANQGPSCLLGFMQISYLRIALPTQHTRRSIIKKLLTRAILEMKEWFPESVLQIEVVDLNPIPRQALGYAE